MKITSIIVFISLIAFSSCRKLEFDEPPIKDIPVGNVLTIQELRDLFQGDPIKFDEDYSVYATITMDDRTGNIYRNAYIQDETNAIVIRTNFPGGLYQGDSIRLYLKGAVLGSFNGLLQVDSVDVDKNIIKQATNKPFTPRVVTIQDLINQDFQSQLVQLNNVEFDASALGQTYANAVNQQSQNRTLVDCDGNAIIVRTSGFANFANETVAGGNGTLIAIANEFNGTKQLLIRNTTELAMTNDRCTGGGAPGESYLFKDFSDQSLTSGGWMTYVAQSAPGTHNWTTSSQGSPGNYYAVATGWTGSSADETDLWLISPAVDLTQAQAPQLKFKSSTRFNGPALKLMISTNYDGISNPTSQGTWTDYSSFVAWSPGDFQWTNSGVIPMLAFLNQPNVYIAFRYTSGSAGGAATWQVDDILIDEN